MERLFIFLILVICFLAFLSSRWLWAINRARRKGLFPKTGKATLFDVRRLLLEGERELAILVYVQIFKTSRKDAEKAVEELERGLPKNKLES